MATTPDGATRGAVILEGGDAVGGSGQFDTSIVERMIRARLRSIQACYDQRLRRNPTLTGKVTVSFTIEVDGRVTGARAVENTVGEQGVADCVLVALGRMRLRGGSPGGVMQFVYPFVFQPRD